MGPASQDGWLSRCFFVPPFLPVSKSQHSCSSGACSMCHAGTAGQAANSTATQHSMTEAPNLWAPRHRAGRLPQQLCSYTCHSSQTEGATGPPGGTYLCSSRLAMQEDWVSTTQLHRPWATGIAAHVACQTTHQLHDIQSPRATKLPSRHCSPAPTVQRVIHKVMVLGGATWRLLAEPGHPANTCTQAQAMPGAAGRGWGQDPQEKPH